MRLLSLFCAGTVLASVSQFANAAPPSFEGTSQPQGWNVVRGQTLEAGYIQSKDGAANTKRDAKALLLETTAPFSAPIQATFRFRAAAGDAVLFRALNGDDPAAGKAALLEFQFLQRNDNQATITARADGQPMATDISATRSYRFPDEKRETVLYSWRYPKIGNLWEERDRNEIGTAFGRLAPFESRIFTARLVVTPGNRQVWMDDRLVAEEQTASPRQVRFSMELEKSARVLSAGFQEPPAMDSRFLPLSLEYYSHKPNADSGIKTAVIETLQAGAQAVPVLKASSPDKNIDIGDSLYRYRMTRSGGPDSASVSGKLAGYVNAKLTWPGSFLVDPASLTFRVPYRDYQNVWLLAYVDGEPDSVAKGAFRFFKENSGHPANNEFEISPEAIGKGLVTPLPQKAPGGQQMYMVKVPIDPTGFYGFRDQKGQSLDFELTKPLVVGRSYPDPIYYGEHGAGLPSSVHVAGITLEEAPFHYEVRPSKFAHVFERPGRPEYSVVIANATAQPLDAKVTLQTRSFDGTDQESVAGNGRIAPGKEGAVPLRLDLKKNGWHELTAIVEAGGTRRETKLSLLLLPPDTRTYGDAVNETRFGSWLLAGHYMPVRPATEGTPAGIDYDSMAWVLRKLGIRRSGMDGATLKKHDLLSDGPHTLVAVFHRLNENDPVAMEKMVQGELAQIAPLAAEFKAPHYLYGGEWGISKETHYAPWPVYTGEGDRPLTEDEAKKVARQTKIFTAIGRAMREKYPDTKLFLQWGSPQATLAFLRTGFPKDLVDGYGMDQPQFELLPELSNIPGSINDLWIVRQESKRLGWPRLPLAWVEGPFLPTNPGALTETQQAENQMRYWLAGLAYGIDHFDAGMVPFDAGNYYSSEHYGAGIFHRTPLLNPKPAAAAVATMTMMLNGADPIGGVDTGVLTTYCMAFEKARDKSKIYALWRVDGSVVATLKVRGQTATVTDAMGNATLLPVQNAEVTVTLSSMPIWLTGVEIESFSFAAPEYSGAPQTVKPLADMTAGTWTYDGTPDELYQTNHFATKRATSPNLSAQFGAGEEGRTDAVGITLAVEPGDRPFVTRYGALKPRQPIGIPGKAKALGMWVKGNSSWGRLAYQVRDAKGEVWTSTGTRGDWNGDDMHGWSYVKFEGWRYVSFPLPGNHPYDDARELETTWWGSRGGDSVVDLPLSIEKIFVEARNEVPYLGEMKLVPNRTYKLSSLVAEYASPQDATEAAIARSRIRKPVVAWSGPNVNPIAHLEAEGVGEAPAIREVVEPGHFNDGRRMVIRFDQKADKKYTLYLSLYADGRGADRIATDVTDQKQVLGFKPDTEVFLFLTATGVDRKESKPSEPYKLTTRDNFREK